MSGESDLKTLIIGLTERLLNAVNDADYPSYTKLVDPNVTSFEPEAVGNLVSGLDFHKYWFENRKYFIFENI